MSAQSETGDAEVRAGASLGYAEPRTSRGRQTRPSSGSCTARRSSALAHRGIARRYRGALPTTAVRMQWVVAFVKRREDEIRSVDRATRWHDAERRCPDSPTVPGD